MTLFMETTQVEDTRTVAEIQHMLAVRGATSIHVEYAAGKVEGLAFTLNVSENIIPYKLPCRWQAVEKLLRREGKRLGRGDSYEAKARRVAWRQIKRWVEAQLALIETGMVQTQEVFLPYAVVTTNDGKTQTMFEMVENRGLLLTGPSDKPTESEQ